MTSTPHTNEKARPSRDGRASRCPLPEGRKYRNAGYATQQTASRKMILERGIGIELAGRALLRLGRARYPFRWPHLFRGELQTPHEPVVPVARVCFPRRCENSNIQRREPQTASAVRLCSCSRRFSTRLSDEDAGEMYQNDRRGMLATPRRSDARTAGGRCAGHELKRCDHVA